MTQHRDHLARIAALEKQAEHVQERLKALKSRHSTSVKKTQARRTFLVGACVISALETDPALRGILQKKLDQFLTREGDRDLLVDLITTKGV
jgi:hypothetical protein